MSEMEQPIQSERVREILRRREQYHSREVAINYRDGAYRTTCMAIAFDGYGDGRIPDSATQIYDPSHHCLIIDLPEIDTPKASLSDFADE